MLFRVPVSGGLRDHILVILDFFWGVFWRPFGALLGYHFWIDFRRISGALHKSKYTWRWGDLRGIWGPVTGLNQQDKQIYRWKSADL